MGAGQARLQLQPLLDAEYGGVVVGDVGHVVFGHPGSQAIPVVGGEVGGEVGGGEVGGGVGGGLVSHG
ncbi:hypothetical protein GCM10009081_14180 [Brevundimonas nasdae]